MSASFADKRAWDESLRRFNRLRHDEMRDLLYDSGLGGRLRRDASDERGGKAPQRVMVSALLQKMKRHNGAVLEFTQEKCDEWMDVGCVAVFIVAYANVGFCSDADVGAYRRHDFVLFRVTNTIAAENVNGGKHFEEN